MSMKVSGTLNLNEENQVYDLIREKKSEDSESEDDKIYALVFSEKIGVYSDINKTFEFFKESEDKFLVCIGEDKFPFDTTHLNDLKIPITGLTNKQKIQYCLKNRFFYPTVNEKANKVFFKSKEFFFKTMPFCKKQWQNLCEFELPEEKTNKILPLFDGSILVVYPGKNSQFGSRFFNVWNPISDKLITLNSHDLSVFKDGRELESSFLAMLTENGAIEIWDWKNKKFQDEIKFENEKIEKIYTFFKNMLALKISDAWKIYDLSSKSVVDEISNIEFLKKVSDGSFLCKEKNKNVIDFYFIDKKTNKLEIEKSYHLNMSENQSLEKFQVLSTDKLLIILKFDNGNPAKIVKIINSNVESSEDDVFLTGNHNLITSNYCETEILINNRLCKVLAAGYKDNELCYWDLQTGKSHKDKVLKNNVPILELKNLSDNSLVLRDFFGYTLVDSKLEIQYHESLDRSEESPQVKELFDGTIAIGTRKSVKIFNSKLEIQYHESLDRSEESNQVKELFDGTIALGTNKSIKTFNSIYKPIVTDDKLMRKQIDLLLDILKNEPQNFQIYDVLLRKQIDDNFKYNLLLMGIQEAMKINNLYRARRFYEKAILKKPQKDTSHIIYLIFLDDLHHKKEKLRVYNNLYKLHKKKKYLVEYKKLGGQKRCKERLIIGDGNNTFTKDLIFQHIKGHPNLAKSITATEITDDYLKYDDIKQRVMELMNKGVKCFFDVDATQIHKRFKGKRFPRIHWNCPYGKYGPLPGSIGKFFQSAAQLQLPFDRIHMALAQESHLKERKRASNYNIVSAATSAGYRLIRKREFNSRFPNYKHVKTGYNESNNSSAVKKEFIFEKIPVDEFLDKIKKNPINNKFYDLAISLRNTKKKNFQVIPYEGNSFYYDCSTDNDTSDYYDSNTDEEDINYKNKNLENNTRDSTETIPLSEKRDINWLVQSSESEEENAAMEID